MHISLANSIVPFNFSTIDEISSVLAIMSLVPCNHTSLLITFLLALTFFPPLSPSFFVFHPLTGLVVGACLAILSLLPLLAFFSQFAASGTLLRRFLRYVFEKQKIKSLFFLMFVSLAGWLNDWLIALPWVLLGWVFCYSGFPVVLSPWTEAWLVGWSVSGERSCLGGAGRSGEKLR